MFFHFCFCFFLFFSFSVLCFCSTSHFTCFSLVVFLVFLLCFFDSKVFEAFPCHLSCLKVGENIEKRGSGGDLLSVKLLCFLFMFISLSLSLMFFSGLEVFKNLRGSSLFRFVCF